MTAPKPPSVLIVDDLPDAAASLAACLMFRGYDARAAAGGREALALLGPWVPDVAVLDLGMSGMSGYELAGRVCGALPRRPVLIALTGGFDYYFAKPVDPGQLDAVLRSVGQGDRARPRSTGP
jgi:CheY-like chemotaxis protein